MPTKNLYTTFHFTDEELRANQAGKLTPNQHKRLWAKYRQRVPMYGASLSLTLIGVMALFTSRSPINVPVVLFITAGMLLFLLGLWYADWATVRDEVIQGRVAVTRGAIHLMPHSRALTLDIDRLRFPISLGEAHVFEPGQRYCIYYAPLSHTILSVKALESSHE